jgi:hypothetical protein
LTHGGYLRVDDIRNCVLHVCIVCDRSKLNEDTILKLNATNLDGLEELWYRFTARLRIYNGASRWVLVRRKERDTRSRIIELGNLRHSEADATLGNCVCLSSVRAEVRESEKMERMVATSSEKIQSPFLG